MPKKSQINKYSDYFDIHHVGFHRYSILRNDQVDDLVINE